MAFPAVVPPRELTRSERIRVKCEELLARVRELGDEGNVRRIHIIGEDGTSIMEFPRTAEVFGAIITLLIEAHSLPGTARAGASPG